MNDLYLVIGCRGQLGSEFMEYFRASGIPHEGFDLPEFDITRPESILRQMDQRIGRLPADTAITIINPAAYTDVEKAETDIDACYAVNVDGALHCAVLANELKADLVHFSTDYVFDGRSSRPYTEKDAVAPLTQYGRSKLEGELAVMRTCPGARIIRLSWLFGVYGKNFITKILGIAGNRKQVKVVNDQFGIPTYTGHVVRQTMSLLKTKAHGIFHGANHGKATWFDLAAMAVRLAGLETEVVPCSTAEFPTKAVRPAYSVMENSRFKELGIDIMPAWEEGVREYFHRLNARQPAGGA